MTTSAHAAWPWRRPERRLIRLPTTTPAAVTARSTTPPQSVHDGLCSLTAALSHRYHSFHMSKTTSPHATTPPTAPLPTPLATAITVQLLARWSIGVSSSFCDESDWDAASEAEIAAAVDLALAPTLAKLAAADEMVSWIAPRVDEHAGRQVMATFDRRRMEALEAALAAYRAATVAQSATLST